MEFVIFWIICGGVAAMIASSKGGSGGLGFAAGLLLGPIGIVVALLMGSEAGKVEKQVSSVRYADRAVAITWALS